MAKVYVFAGFVIVISAAITFGVILYKAATFKRKSRRNEDKES